MKLQLSGYGPYSNACDDTANISIGGDSSPLSFNFTTDKQQGACALQVNVGNPSGVGCNAGNFGLYNQGIEVESANYGYVHIWVKPLTPGSWMTFHCWDVDNNDWKTLKGDKDGDMYYEADQDMAVGQWNELWLKLDNNTREWTQTTVRSFSMHASNNASFIIDGVFTCSRDWKTFYYHCDYLNSPRVMTDATGAVVWRQDYLAFGQDYNTTATGNTHKFTGHIQDAATGQYYAKARFFKTEMGRWTQPEPMLKSVPTKGYLSNPQLLNPYVYCINNPVRIVDPNGKNPIVLGVGIAGVGGLVGAGAEMLKLAATRGATLKDYGYAGAKGFAAGAISTGAFLGSSVATGNLVLAGAFSGSVYSGVSQGMDAYFKKTTPSITQALIATGTGAVLGPITGLATPVGRPTSLLTPLSEIGPNGTWALNNAAMYNIQSQTVSTGIDLLSQNQLPAPTASATPTTTSTQQSSPTLPQIQSAVPDQTEQ